MSRIDKLVERLKSNPRDLTWNEAKRILTHFGYEEVSRKGKTSGSRRKFKKEGFESLVLHEPHPDKVLKRYMIALIMKRLNI